MLENKEEKKHIDHDERGNPLMTLKTIQYYCNDGNISKSLDLYEKLYLQSKGFKVIQNLGNFPNLVGLWLNNNSISKISGLDLQNLTCLYLQYNSIAKIQNLENLKQLSVLSLAHNKIQVVEGLSCLVNLNSLNLSENFISTPNSFASLLQCPSITSIDLSKNQIQNTEESFKIISKLANVSCLYLKGTPFARGFKNFRKRIIASLKKIKFLDDRPVQEIDHRLCEAWLKGGAELQQEERVKIALEKQEKNKKQASEVKERSEKEMKKQEEKEKLQKKKSQLEKQELTEEVMEELKETEKRLEYLKEGPKGFQAKITDTNIKILHVENDQKEKEIIDKYFSNEKKKIEENLKNKQAKEEESEQKITKKVKTLLKLEEEEQEDQYLFYWKVQYEPLLEALLEKSKFDFAQVQPSFNMIMAEINKKMMRVHRRFEIHELRKIWTGVELKKRKQNIDKK